jgi:LuxR family maltose regulon positive regulatory protein
MLKRGRIDKIMERIFQYPLTIIEAPMGYGKTTAVKEFLLSRSCPVMWVAFLGPEDTASCLWEALTKEISKLDRDTGDRLKSLGFPADAPQTANILAVLNDMSFEKKTTLVIDDFHFVKDEQIGGFIVRLIKENPENLHTVIITRDTTNLKIAELSAKGLCNIVSQQQLKFTDKEIRDYCALTGDMPPEDDIKKIAEYTGGWISLIYLVLLGLENGIPVGKSRVIEELIESVLYNAYDETVRGFLTKLAVMDSFSADQALYVTQEKTTDALLKKLCGENAFINYDEADGVYRIHNVLLDFLRMKRQNNADLSELCIRAAQWHLKQKDYRSAYVYLYRAGETDRILALLDEEDNVTNDFAEFDGWIEMFEKAARELLFQYPFAYLQYLLSMLFCKGEDPERTVTRRLDEFQEYIESRNNILPDKKSRILAEISVARIFTVFNDAEKMFAFSDQALSLLDGGRSCMIKRKSEFTFGSPHFLYSYYKQAGSLKYLAAYMSERLPGFASLSDGCGTGSEYLVIAEQALETGDWHEAELNAYKAIYKARTKDQIGIAICAGFTLIRLNIYWGKISEGLELLRELRQDVLKENNAIYNTTMELCEGYVYCCLGLQDKIPAWLRTGDISPARFLYQGLGFNYIVYGKAVLLDNNYIELEMLTEAFDESFSVLNNRLGYLHNRIFGAVAQYRLYGMEKGCAALTRVLELGRADNILLPFAENAPDILGMLRFISGGTHDEYYEAALLSCENYMESLKRFTKSEVRLSARELEVLKLTAEGLKRDEIAGRLIVSAGTVKTHLQNIYQKLEVQGKTAAIKKAEKMKIL